MERVIEPCRYIEDYRLPYVVGYAPSTPGHNWICARCQKPMTMYIATLLPGNWVGNYYDSECFWELMWRGSNVISVKLILGFDTLQWKDQAKLLSEIAEFQQYCFPDDNLIGREYFFNVTGDIRQLDAQEKKSREQLLVVLGRMSVSVNQIPLTCILCKKNLPVDRIAMSFQTFFAHVECVLKCSLVFGHYEDVQGYKSLTSEQQEVVRFWFDHKHETFQPKNEGDFIYHFGSRRRVFVLSTAALQSCAPNPPTDFSCQFCQKPLTEGELLFIVENQPTHPICIFKDACMIFDTPETIPFWEGLPEQGKKKILMEYLCAVTNENTVAMTFPRVFGEPNPSAKKPKDQQHERLRKDQVNALHKLRQIFSSASDSVLNNFLQHNRQTFLNNNRRQKVEQVADIIFFGVPVRCPKCKCCVIYNLSRRTYVCTGYISRFLKCDFESKNPERIPFSMPAIYPNKSCFPFDKNCQRLYADDGEGDIVQLSVGLPPEVYEFCNNKFSVDDLLVSNHKFSYLIVQGSPVPQYIPNANHYHVLTEKKMTFECFLIYFNFVQNRNTCYNLLILEDDFHENQFIVCRTGTRVGTKIGATMTVPFSNKEDAIKYFKKQFHDLTGLYWRQRSSRCIPGRFMFLLVQRNGITMDCNRLEFIMRHILPKDYRKYHRFQRLFSSAHLGSVTGTVVPELTQILRQSQTKIARGIQTRQDYIEITNVFFSAAPTCFGIGPVDFLDSPKKITDITKEMPKRIENSVKTGIKEHPCFSLCKELKIQFKILDDASSEFMIVKKYAENTVGEPHRELVSFEITDVLKIRRAADANLAGGKVLLWYGTEKANLAGIMRNGLAAMTASGATTTESGLHFTDCFSKSFLTDSNPLGTHEYLLLCEVLIGNCFKNYSPDKEDEVAEMRKAGSIDSVKVSGKYIPDRTDCVMLDGTSVPFGKLIMKPEAANSSGALFNELIVFDATHVNLKYLVRVKNLLKPVEPQLNSM